MIISLQYVTKLSTKDSIGSDQYDVKFVYTVADLRLPIHGGRNG